MTDQPAPDQALRDRLAPDVDLLPADAHPGAGVGTDAASGADAGTDADTDTDPDAEPTRDALKSARGELVAASMGSFMAGIEQLVFQRRPPAVELVHQAQPVRGVTGDGLEITLHIPGPPDDPTPVKR